MNLVNVDIFGVWNFIQFLLFGFSTPNYPSYFDHSHYFTTFLDWINRHNYSFGWFFSSECYAEMGYKYRKEMLNQTDERSQAP